MYKYLISALALTLGIILAACAAPQALPPQSSIQETPQMGAPLTIERLYASPSLSGPSPRGVKFSPDGKRVTFLKARADEGERYDLWQFDVATGEQSLLVDSKLLEPEEVELSEEEKALRERKRIAGSKGIVSYDWGTADTILVPIGGDLYLITLGEDGPQVAQLTDTEAFEYDARISPTGRYVSFIRDGALYAIELANGEELQQSPDAEPGKAISYGVAEFVAQEEMSRYTGYWWSPDDRYIAYTRVDESTVDIIPRFEIAAEDVTVVNQRYPRAGRPNAIVDLFVRDLETGKVEQVNWRRDDWGPATDQYLARVNWAYNNIAVRAVDRDQKVLQTSIYSASGEKLNEFAETADNWINVSSDFSAFINLRRGTAHWAGPLDAIVTDEQDGYRRIVYQADINCSSTRVAISPEGSVVKSIVNLSGNPEIIYFTAYEDDPLEHHLYQMKRPLNHQDLRAFGWEKQNDCNYSYDKGTSNPITDFVPTRITEPGKSWSITMSPDGQSFVGTSSAPDQPPQTGLYKADGSLIAWIEENRLDETHPYYPYLAEHTVPEFGTLTAEDGQTLYYSIQKPPHFDAGKKYPVLVEVYGGPHVQTVTRNWERMSDQFYSRQGYIVFRLDNRGSANRGKKFEDVIYRRTGGPEVRDQLVGVDWLKSQPFVDADRIGIQGWSYGGYMTLMTILQAPEGTFAAAVSGAPVTDWALYDTFYTERYMDTPQDNPEGYEASSVFPYLDNLTTPLLLMHGMADDNVTFDNSTRLYAELQKRGLPFEMMTYPGQRHGIRGEDLQVHLMKTRMAFLDRYLKGKED